MIENIIGHQPFGVRLEVDPDVAGFTTQDLVDRLKAGDPPVSGHASARAMSISPSTYSACTKARRT